jgi:hypothetical protein
VTKTIAITIVALLGTVSCKNKEDGSKGTASKSSACDKARDLQVEAMRKYARPITAKIDSDEQRAANAKANEEFDAYVARVEKEFGAVCEELGADKVLACITANIGAREGGQPVADDCQAMLEEFRKRIPPPEREGGTKLDAIEPAGPHPINTVLVGEAGTVEAIEPKLEGYTVDKGETQMDDGAEIGTSIEVSKGDTPVASILVVEGKIHEIKVVDPSYGVQGTQTRIGEPLPDLAQVTSCHCMGEDGFRGFYCDIGSNTNVIFETKEGDCSFTTADEARAAVKERSVKAIARVAPPAE